jgi:hypothetical protein
MQTFINNYNFLSLFEKVEKRIFLKTKFITKKKLYLFELILEVIPNV